MRIAIDIGHGKHNRVRGKYDPGAVKYGEEHTRVTGMGYRLKADLVAMGHEVLITEDMPLTERDDKAKAWKADILISLHFNAGGGKGTEVWCNTAFDKRSRNVAANVRKQMKALGFADRGTKYSDKFAVLRANKNDCLIEICFIDSKQDMALFDSKVDAVELALLNGILAGLGKPTVATLPSRAIKPKPALRVTVKPQVTRYVVHTVKVTASKLNVRREPSKNGEVVASLKKNQVVKVGGNYHGWYRVLKPAGYISADYVKVVG